MYNDFTAYVGRESRLEIAEDHEEQNSRITCRYGPGDHDRRPIVPGTRRVRCPFASESTQTWSTPSNRTCLSDSSLRRRKLPSSRSSDSWQSWYTFVWFQPIFN